MSLTTYGDRAENVAYAIESIANGQHRPRRIVLWLADQNRYENLPAALRRLQRRGLEIKLTEDLGPHKKYYPTLPLAIAAGLPLVTADDDALYPRSWLAGLLGAAAAQPGIVHCYRANVICLWDGQLAPYESWARCQDSVASVARFATGVSGIYYPPAMLAELARLGTAFRDTAPRADDVWLHWVALRTSTPVRQVDAKPRTFPNLPGSQKQSLTSVNVDGGGNDQQLAALYDATDVAVLRAAGAPDLGTPPNPA